MRQIPPDLQASLSAGVTTLCWCWQVTRRDGAVFGFTDHDRALDVAGQRYEPGCGFGLDRFEQDISLTPGHGQLSGVIEAETITRADIEAGLWSGARVDILRVDWARPELFARVRCGEIGEIRLREGRFEAELRGLSHRLDRVTGRVFSRRCHARLGDADCRIAPDHPEHARGCDKRFATCRDRFGNTLNFRGFPYMIGNDVLLAGAAGESVHDGSSRGLGE